MSETMTILNRRFTIHILFAMVLGIAAGLAFKYVTYLRPIEPYFISYFCAIIGAIFINLIKMLVLPIVIVSLVSGAADLKGFGAFGRIGGKAFLIYMCTTALAVFFALLFADLFHVGQHVKATSHSFTAAAVPSIQSVLINMFPSNPFASIAKGDLLPVVVFSLLFGLAVSMSGKAGEKVAEGFRHVNAVVIRLVMMIIQVAPVGVFCLLATQFSKIGWHGVVQVAGYFFTVLLVLILQLLVVYSGFLKVFANVSPVTFFKKMYPNFLFAFTVSSSSATIPVTMNAVKNKLGVSNKIASFVVPVGATVNMDGTAIMQGVATVFIANVYGVHLGLSGYLMVILMAILASIGTAGVPGVGLITLAMVLQQVGLPVDGIAMIFGIDRLLDMFRTAVNVAGDCVVACSVARFENEIDRDIYNEAV